MDCHESDFVPIGYIYFLALQREHIVKQLKRIQAADQRRRIFRFELVTWRQSGRHVTFKWATTHPSPAMYDVNASWAGAESGRLEPAAIKDSVGRHPNQSPNEILNVCVSPSLLQSGSFGRYQTERLSMFITHSSNFW